MSVYCLKSVALGGEWQALADLSAILLVPDDKPGKVYRVVGRAGGNRIQSITNTYGMSGRAAFSGALLSDDTLISDGGVGQLGPNEDYQEQPRGDCPGWVVDLFGTTPPADGPIATTCDPGYVKINNECVSVLPWDGEQRVSINLSPSYGIPENVVVYGVDGFQYRLDLSASEPGAQRTLATTAPQGSPLVIRGRWDPAALIVRVDDWWIFELGPGEREYGIDETGLVAPRAGIPTTANPGGAEGVGATFAEQAAQAAGAAGAANAPASARDNILLIAAVLAALRLLEVI